MAYSDFTPGEVVTRFGLTPVPWPGPPGCPLPGFTDTLKDGQGRCAVELVAARRFNAAANPPADGAVTSGLLWQFLRLDGAALTIDPAEHPVTDPRKTPGVLAAILTEHSPA